MTVNKKDIQQTIKNNGNQSFTIKELVWHLIGKVDKIDDKLSTKVDSKLFYWIVGILFASIAALTSFMFTLI